MSNEAVTESPTREETEPQKDEKPVIEEKNDQQNVTEEEQPKPSSSPVPEQSKNEEEEQLSTSNEEPKTIERRDSNGGTRRSYEANRGNSYTHRNDRPYGGGRGYRNDYYDNTRTGPSVIDHRSPNFARGRGEYHNYSSGGRGTYPSTKRDYGSIRQDDSYDPQTKRMRQSPETYRYEQRGPPGYDQRRPPYPRSTPPIGRGGYDNYGGGYRPQPRYNERPYDANGPPYPQRRDGPPPPAYDRNYDAPRRGDYQGGRSYPRRPMINEERAVASGFDSYNRQPTYREPGYEPPREAPPVVIDRRNPSYNQPPAYNYERRRESYEEPPRRSSSGGAPTGSYYDSNQQPSTYNDQTYHQSQSRESYSRNYSSGGYSDNYSSGSQPYRETSTSNSTPYTSQTTTQSDWKEYTTDDGKKYYHNPKTNTTTWEIPTDK